MLCQAAAASSGPPPGPEVGPRLSPRPQNYKQRLLQQFRGRADKYDEGNTYHPQLAARLVRFARLRPGESVLDVGAGTGFVALPAAEAVGPAGQVVALDLSPEMLDKVSWLPGPALPSLLLPCP